ncbi:MAG TPA: phospholipase D-like domain-containing protein [Nitrospira sp.]|nr:phospholipase D-like domain-containing protein [Nitrospira sp.]
MASMKASTSPPFNGKFLFTPEDLQQEFATLLNKADSLKIAAAWATLGVHVDMLKNAKIPIEAIVGKAFNITHPDAIAALMSLGKVYVDERKTDFGLFHPKVYLFQTGSQYSIIIGSPNLTCGAFTVNAEVSVSFKLDHKSALPLIEHFRNLGRAATPVTTAWLKRYRKQYKPPKSGILKKILKSQSPRENQSSASASTVGDLLTLTWQDYYRLLQKQATRADGKSSLLDKDESYLKTLDVIRPIIQKRFDQLTKEDFRYLIGGNETYPNTGYFGSIAGAIRAVPALMRDLRLRRDITKLIPRLIRARNTQSALAIARSLFLRLVRVKGIKSAVATRFLVLSRPDLFISVNNESVFRLSRLFGIPVSKIKTWEGYELALAKLWQSRWYHSHRPRNVTEAKVWDARAALVDIYASEYEWS